MIKNSFSARGGSALGGKTIRGFSPVELVIMVGFGALAAAALIYLGTTPHYMASSQPVNVNIKVDGATDTSTTTKSRTSSTKASQATGDYCADGVDPFWPQLGPLRGEYITCGNEQLCITKAYGLTDLGFPPMPAGAYTNSFMKSIWAYVPDMLKQSIIQFAQGLYYYHFGNPAPTSLADMKRPSDSVFASEPEFQALDSRTHLVEFNVPASYTTNPNTNIKMRGWYIKGDGFSGEKPLIFMLSGVGSYMNMPCTQAYCYKGRKWISYFVAQGFDVLMVDKRGHGNTQGFGGSWGEDVFRVLDQLETGTNAIGPNETNPSTNKNLLGGYTAKSKPVILLGESQGSAIMGAAMGMNYSNLPLDPRFDSAGNLDLQASAAVSSARSGYNFRGMVGVVGFAGSMKNMIHPLLTLVHSYALHYPFQTPAGLSGNVYNSMDKWPGYMAIKPTQDWITPDGVIDAYNNKLKGFKKIVMVRGIHETADADEHFAFVLQEITKFGKQIVLNDATMDNFGTTSLQKEVCKAPGTQGKLTAADLTMEKLFNMMIAGGQY